MMLFPRMPLQNVPLYGAHVPLGLEKKTPRNVQTNETKMRTLLLTFSVISLTYFR